MPLPLKLKIIEDTPIGPVGIAWGEIGGEPLVVRVLLPEAVPDPGTEEGSCPGIEETAEALRGILAGNPVEVPLETTALELLTPFRQAVLRATARIPRGEVNTYGGLARSLGRERAARAVGNALAANPFPLIIPCHRVIRSDGTIGGFTGGEGIKRRLLELEEIHFDGSRVAQAFLPVRRPGTDRNAGAAETL